MATLPNETALGERPVPQAPQGLAQIQPSNLRAAGIPGIFLERAGSNLQQAGDVILAGNRHFDEIAATDALNKYNQSVNSLEWDPKTGYRTVQGQPATTDDFRKNYGEKLDQTRQTALDGLQNEQQKQMFQQRAAVTDGHFNAGLMQHQARETENYADKVDNEAVNGFIAHAVTNPGNDMIWATSAAGLSDTVARAASRHGITDPATVNEMQRHQLGTAVFARAQAMAVNDPDGASAFANTFKEALGTRYAELEQHLKVATQSRDSLTIVNRMLNPQAFDPTRNTPDQIAAAEPQILTALRGEAEKAHPGDQEFAAHLDALGRSRVSEMMGLARGAETARTNQLYDLRYGRNPDGSDAARSLEGMLSTEYGRSLWNGTSPQAREAFRKSFENGEKGLPRSAETERNLDLAIGEATSPDPATREKFRNMTPEQFTRYVTQDHPMTDQGINHARQVWASMRTTEEKAEAKEIPYEALLNKSRGVWAAAGIKAPTATSTQSQKDDFSAFYGRFQQEMDQFRAETGKMPSDKEANEAAARLAKDQYHKPGRWWGFGASVRGFAVPPEEEGRFMPALSDKDQKDFANQRTTLSAKFQNRFGLAPTDAELTQIYMQQKLHPYDRAGRAALLDDIVRSIAARTTKQAGVAPPNLAAQPAKPPEAP